MSDSRGHEQKLTSGEQIQSIINGLITKYVGLDAVGKVKDKEGSSIGADAKREGFRRFEEMKNHYSDKMGCELLRTTAPPTVETLQRLPIATNAAYIQCNDKFYYVNKSRQQCIDLKTDVRNPYDEFFSLIGELKVTADHPRIPSWENGKKIWNIIGETPRQEQEYGATIVEMKVAPNKASVDKLELKTNTAFLIYNKEVYYVNYSQEKDFIKKIELKKRNPQIELRAFLQEKKIEDNKPIALSEQDFDNITHITGHVDARGVEDQLNHFVAFVNAQIKQLDEQIQSIIQKEVEDKNDLKLAESMQKERALQEENLNKLNSRIKSLESDFEKEYKAFIKTNRELEEIDAKLTRAREMRDEKQIQQLATEYQRIRDINNTHSNMAYEIEKHYYSLLLPKLNQQKQLNDLTLAKAKEGLANEKIETKRKEIILAMKKLEYFINRDQAKKLETEIKETPTDALKTQLDVINKSLSSVLAKNPEFKNISPPSIDNKDLQTQLADLRLQLQKLKSPSGLRATQYRYQVALRAVTDHQKESLYNNIYANAKLFCVGYPSLMHSGGLEKLDNLITAERIPFRTFLAYQWMSASDEKMEFSYSGFLEEKVREILREESKNEIDKSTLNKLAKMEMENPKSEVVTKARARAIRFSMDEFTANLANIRREHSDDNEFLREYKDFDNPSCSEGTIGRMIEKLSPINLYSTARKPTNADPYIRLNETADNFIAESIRQADPKTQAVIFRCLWNSLLAIPVDSEDQKVFTNYFAKTLSAGNLKPYYQMINDKLQLDVLNKHDIQEGAYNIVKIKTQLLLNVFDMENNETPKQDVIDRLLKMTATQYLVNDADRRLMERAASFKLELNQLSQELRAIERVIDQDLERGKLSNLYLRQEKVQEGIQYFRSLLDQEYLPRLIPTNMAETLLEDFEKSYQELQDSQLFEAGTPRPPFITQAEDKIGPRENVALNISPKEQKTAAGKEVKAKDPATELKMQEAQSIIYRLRTLSDKQIVDIQAQEKKLSEKLKKLESSMLAAKTKSMEPEAKQSDKTYHWAERFIQLALEKDTATNNYIFDKREARRLGQLLVKEYVDQPEKIHAVLKAINTKLYELSEFYGDAFDVSKRQIVINFLNPIFKKLFTPREGAEDKQKGFNLNQSDLLPQAITTKLLKLNLGISPENMTPPEWLTTAKNLIGDEKKPNLDLFYQFTLLTLCHNTGLSEIRKNEADHLRHVCNLFLSKNTNPAEWTKSPKMSATYLPKDNSLTARVEAFTKYLKDLIQSMFSLRNHYKTGSVSFQDDVMTQLDKLEQSKDATKYCCLSISRLEPTKMRLLWLQSTDPTTIVAIDLPEMCFKGVLTKGLQPNYISLLKQNKGLHKEAYNQMTSTLAEAINKLKDDPSAEAKSKKAKWEAQLNDLKSINPENIPITFNEPLLQTAPIPRSHLGVAPIITSSDFPVAINPTLLHEEKEIKTPTLKSDSIREKRQHFFKEKQKASPQRAPSQINNPPKKL